MADTRVFNESVFHSYVNLKNFFQQSDAIGQVLSHKDEPFSKPLIPWKPNLALKWQVCQIATAPFRWILAIVIKIISKVAKALGATSVAEQMRIIAKYLFGGFDTYSEEPYPLYKIKTTVNHPNRFGEKRVNHLPAIPESKIVDPKVKSKTFCSLYHAVRFKHHNGICRGMTEWFLYLYLKTKDQFPDPRRHMVALGKQFSKGGGVDPTLLQSLSLKKGRLLDMKIGTQPVHSGQSRALLIPLLAYVPNRWKSSAQEIVGELQNIPAGAYDLWVPRHAVAYVKVNDRLSYFFDPNDGIIEINGPEQGKKVYDFVVETMKNIKLEERHRNMSISICPYTLRN